MIACEALFERRYRRSVILERYEGRVLQLLRGMRAAIVMMRELLSDVPADELEGVTVEEMLRHPQAFSKNEIKRAKQREQEARDLAHENRYGEDNFDRRCREQAPPSCMPRLRRSLSCRRRRQNRQRPATLSGGGPLALAE